MSGIIKIKQRIPGWVSFLLIFTSIFCVIGCGGGGGGSSTNGSPQSETNFRLPSRDLYVGYSEAWDISGTATSTTNRNNTANVSGNLQIEVLDIETYQGESAYPVEEMVNLTIDGTAIATKILTNYYDMSFDPISIVDETGEITKTPIRINDAPEIAEIGDFGQLTSWRYSDGSEEYRTWRLEEAGGDRANYIKTRTRKNQYDRTISYAEIKYKIDIDGNILSQNRNVSDYENDIEYDLVYTRR